jgi:hypothetical protein
MWEIKLKNKKLSKNGVKKTRVNLKKAKNMA